MIGSAYFLFKEIVVMMQVSEQSVVILVTNDGMGKLDNAGKVIAI